MNIIFLTLERILSFDDTDMYSGLMRKFRNEGHKVYIVSPLERCFHQPTSYEEFEDGGLLRVKILNMQKTGIVEKGLSTLLIESQYKRAIKKYLGDISFDLITYSTPPITLIEVIKYLKKKNPSAVAYLQLKDIFPQNAVDLGMFSENSLFYKYFRKKEKQLYLISDYIGCMSPANVDYVIAHNPYYPADRVEVAPNSIEVSSFIGKDKSILEDIGIPVDRPVFIYGGNLGKPQGIDYLISCLNENKDRKDCFFVVVGSGTEFGKLKQWYDSVAPSSVKVLAGLPKEKYDKLVKACDVGLIFLDNRFTIPNYPSRILSYLENKMPVICATDINTDMGQIAEKNGYGFWCESKTPSDFTALVNKMLKSDIVEMGKMGYEFLCQNYLVQHTYDAIIKHFSNV